MIDVCPRVLLLDNHDSFTWNLVHAIRSNGAAVEVYRAGSPVDPRDPRFTHVVVSPGPGHPEDALAARDLVARCHGRLPLLGVCLGHQVIALHLGARIRRAPAPVHGKASVIAHTGEEILSRMEPDFRAGRYHSLCVDPASLPSSLRPIAHSEDGVLQAVLSEDAPTWGVQFHPESVLTPGGERILAWFIAHGATSCRGRP